MNTNITTAVADHYVGDPESLAGRIARMALEVLLPIGITDLSSPDLIGAVADAATEVYDAEGVDPNDPSEGEALRYVRRARLVRLAARTARNVAQSHGRPGPGIDFDEYEAMDHIEAHEVEAVGLKVADLTAPERSLIQGAIHAGFDRHEQNRR